LEGLLQGLQESVVFRWQWFLIYAKEGLSAVQVSLITHDSCVSFGLHLCENP
jgi:hypothetical protein